jgi:hypothetical protein
VRGQVPLLLVVKAAGGRRYSIAISAQLIQTGPSRTALVALAEADLLCTTGCLTF